jgi:hypothetical protein
MALAEPVAASERYFAFSHQSRVLAAGEAELTPWTTVRAGREHHYAAFDQRLEFQLGLAPNLQTALHWNFGAASASVLDGASSERHRASSFDFESLASEWRYKLSDALADALGSALYLVGSYGPDQATLEGKLIFDKQLGNWLLVLNLGGEQAWKVEGEETESEQHLRFSVGTGYFVTPSLVLGAEAIGTTTLLAGEELETSRIHLGPSLAYVTEHYWFVLSAAPQIFAPKAADGDSLDLARGERLWARVILGFPL